MLVGLSDSQKQLHLKKKKRISSGSAHRSNKAVLQGRQAPFQTGYRAWQYHAGGPGFENIKYARLKGSLIEGEASQREVGSDSLYRTPKVLLYGTVKVKSMVC